MSTTTVCKRDLAAKVKALRRAGSVPCVIFGASLPQSLPVQLEQSAAQQLLRQKRVGSKLELQLDGEVIPAQVKDVDRDFATNDVIHISFQMLDADKKVNSRAQIILLNRDKVPGTLEQLLFEIPFSSLPKDMVDTVSIDLEGLPVGSIVTVGDLPEFQGGKAEPQVGADSVVLKIKDKKRQVQAEE